MVKVDPAATGLTKVVLGPCRYRAIHSGHDRSRADNHGATPKQPRPASFLILAGDNPARSGFGSKGSMLPTWLSNYRKLRKSEHTDERSPGT
jgi:hypothetical protein